MNMRNKFGIVAGVCLAMMLLWATGAVADGTGTYVNVGNRVWLDTNGDGVQDADEPGIGGVTIRADVLRNNDVAYQMFTTTTLAADTPTALADGTPVAAADRDGWYNFNIPWGSKVTITITDTVGFLADLSPTWDLDGLATPKVIWTAPNPSAADYLADPRPAINASRFDADFGFNSDGPKLLVKVAISGHVYKDSNGDGVMDANASLLGATRIDLYAGSEATGTPVATVTPCPSGTFSFTDLDTGVYTVVETNLPNYNSTNAIPGQADGARLDNDTIVVQANLDGVVVYPNQDFLDTANTPGLKLEKTGPPTAKAGETITYTFKVTNTGSSALSNVYVDDPLLGGRIWSASSLAGGATVTFVKTYTVPTNLSSSSCSGYRSGFDCTTGGSGGGSQAGTLVNTATATGYVACWTKVTSTSSCTTVVTAPTNTPGIKLVKTGPATAKAGATILYTFKVTNTGSSKLSNVYVEDPLLGGKIWSACSLAGGATVTFIKSYKIPTNTGSGRDNNDRGGSCGYRGTFDCTTGGSGGSGSGSQTSTLVNTATATGYVLCWTKVTSTSSCTTTVTTTTTSKGSWDWGWGWGDRDDDRDGGCGDRDNNNGGSNGGGRNYSCFDR
ncbi:MAG: SdrD B-like domain-containing protein [Armatimonadota bacterium]